MSIRNSRKANSERGATIVEYGLMLSLVGCVCIGVTGSIGNQLSVGYLNILATLQPDGGTDHTQDPDLTCHSGSGPQTSGSDPRNGNQSQPCRATR